VGATGPNSFSIAFLLYAVNGMELYKVQFILATEIEQIKISIAILHSVEKNTGLNI
jgi:hypothetical protein